MVFGDAVAAWLTPAAGVRHLERGVALFRGLGDRKNLSAEVPTAWSTSRPVSSVAAAAPARATPLTPPPSKTAFTFIPTSTLVE